MRRAWWLGVVLVACDFDAAYERRCDAGLCAPSGGGSSGGQSGGGASGGSAAGGQSGGATAGGQGGGATAGGQGGGAGALCGTTPTLEVTVFDGGVTPISATACVKLEIALRCQGVRLDAGVPVQVGVVNTSTPQPRSATLYADPGCTNSRMSAVTGDVFFDSRSGANGYMFGTYLVSVDAGTPVGRATRVVALEAGISGSFSSVLLPVNACLTLPGISFVGLADSIPVLAPGRQQFTGSLAAPLTSCGGPVELVVNAGESASSVMPRVTASMATIGGAGFMLYGDAGQVSYLVRPCITDGGTTSSSLCCQSPALLMSDGGFWCE